MYTKNEISNFSVSELESFIKENSQKYYDGNPEISDDMFDYAINILKNIDPKNKILTTTGHGFNINNTNTNRKKYDHPYGNMDSIFNKPRCISDIPKDIKVSPLVRVSAKLDGISGEIIFKDGKFLRGLTRGNGKQGFDISDKVKIILKESKAIKEGIPGFTGSIRGEFIFSNKNWEEYKNSIDPNALNPRNTTSGLIMKQENTGVNYLSFVPYKVLATDNLRIFIGSIEDVNDFLKEYFDDIVPYHNVNSNSLSQSFLESEFEDFKKIYPCDGCVITNYYISNLISEDTVLYNYKECAYKFKSEEAETEVINIEWNRTRTGKLVPVCKLKPVFISGTNVSRVSAFNAEFIIKNGIGPHAIIKVMKSGEIIPYITEVIKKVEPSVPKVCPYCGESLVKKGTDIWCINKNCSANDESDLFHFTGIIGEVYGLGDSVKRDFFENNEITKVEDLFNKELDEYIYPETPAAYNKIKEMMNKIRNEEVDPIKGLIALNIPRLGWESAKKLVNSGMLKYFDENIYELKYNQEFQIMSEFILGPATTKSIIENLDRAIRFTYYKGIKSLKKENSEVEIKGKVVVTGKLNTCKRSEFEEIISKAGYILDGGIKKDTKFLITNTPNSGSSKNKKADELGITKITEEEFLRMIGYGD